MIDSFLNLVFRCPHRRLTRPVTPVNKAGVPHGQTYVVCLDCGKQFAYDPVAMHMGKALKRSPHTGVLPPDMPRPRGRQLKYALWASVPVAFLLGSILKNKKPADSSVPGQPPTEPAQAKKNSES
jgi:hypothetical protein